jgi:hypothetical protein
MLSTGQLTCITKLPVEQHAVDGGERFRKALCHHNPFPSRKAISLDDNRSSPLPYISLRALSIREPLERRRWDVVLLAQLLLQPQITRVKVSINLHRHI